MYIITPCSRPQNLEIMFEYMQFDKIDKWIIVHDTKFSKNMPIFDSKHDKILELKCAHGTHGIAQRNMGLAHVPPDGLVYFLDDDNIIQPQFWEHVFDRDSITTFDTFYDHNNIKVLVGSKPKRLFIDTCQIVLPRKYCMPWYSEMPNESQSDGTFVENVMKWYGSKHVYVPKTLSGYNVIRNFNALHYASIHSDVAKVFGTNVDCIRQHFFTFGYKEHRRTC